MFFGKVFPYPSQNLPKTKMVRMVHRKGFYNTELKKCDPKMELWGKTEILRRSKNSKFSLVSQIGLLRRFSKTTLYLKYSEVFRNHSGLIFNWNNVISNKIDENKPKSIKIDPVVVVSPGNCNKYPSMILLFGVCFPKLLWARGQPAGAFRLQKSEAPEG